MAKKAKKVMKAKEEAQKFLADVPGEYVFRCHDGQILRNMKELAEALTGMTDETFVYHSNVDKRDFSCWVRDVIGDEKLAKDLENAPNRTAAAGYMATRIASLSKELA
jgi:predicted Zn-dependent protease